MDGKKRSFLSNVLRGALALGIGAAVVAGVTATPSSVMAAEPTSDRDSGIEVNLHDYSVSEKRNVNTNKSLKFGTNDQRGGVGDGDYSINAWTGSGNGVHQGIVKSYLTAGEDGELYPSLAGNGQSLKYLFDLSGNNTSSVWNYRNLSGLLEKDSDGYWEYDSAKNFVSISRGQDREYAFSKDEEPRARRANNTDIAADEPLFLPFNDVDSGWSRAKDNNGNRMNYEERYINKAWDNNHERWVSSESANYSFGMDISANFYMPKGGMIDNQEMVFSFTGDDDVWVFIDDMLVLDLGGIHDARQGTINFATGEVWVDRVYNENKTNTDDKTISLRELFEAALQDQDYRGDEINKRLSEDFNENGTFKDYSSHTIKFYYLERGNGGSNCQIRFNLPTIPEGTLGFTKDVTYTNVNDTSDIDFLFNAYIDPDGDEGTENYALYNGPYVVVDADTNRFIELKETERIDINGDGTYSAEEQNVIVLKDGQRALITSENTYGQDAQASVEIDQLSKFYVKELGATSDKYEVSVNGTVIEAQTAGGENTIPGVQSPEFVVSEDPYITFGNKISAENRLTLKVEKSGAYDPNDTFYVKVMIGDKLYGSGDGTGAESGVYYVYNSDGTPAGFKTTSNGVIELKGGQYAEIRYIAGGNSISVVEVADANGSSVFAEGEKYKDPSYRIAGTSDSSGSALDPDSIKDVDASDPLQGITATTNEGKGLGHNPVVTATVSNSLIAEPVKPELHKYVDDNEDGTYDLSLDVHGKVRQDQSDPTKVDIVYVLDLSYSMMWEMNGDFPNNGDNPSGDEPSYKYSYARYIAALDSIRALNSSLDQEGIDARAALVAFANDATPNVEASTHGFQSVSEFTIPDADYRLFESGTNWDAGLVKAEEFFSQFRSDARTVVVFISDGQPTYSMNDDGTINKNVGAEAACSAAEDVAKGMQIDDFYVVGVGQESFEQYLERLANSAESAERFDSFKGTSSDELVAKFEGIAAEITSVDCKNVVIKDTLSKYAELTDDATFNVTITKGDHGGEPVDVTGGHVSIDDAKDGADLTFQSDDGTIQTLKLVYDENAKTFTLTFPSNYALEAGWTYTITTQIQPTEDARKYYQENGNSPDKGDLETDVPGTPENEWISSGKPGFHSNHEATLSYTSAKQDKVDEYPNPVIQANQLTIKDVLKVTKTLNGHPLDEGMFDFTVEPKAWDNGNEGDEKVEVTAQQAADKAGLTAGTTYTYQNVDSAQPGEAGLVRMGNEITFTTDDIGKTYVYEYAELGHLNEDYLDDLGENEITNNDVLFDSTQYKVELSVSEDNGQLQVTMTKFSRESESDQWTSVESKVINSSNCDCTEGQPLMSIAFENTAVMPQSITYAVSVAKVLEGAGLENNMFEFSIEARKTGTGESEVTAEEAAARALLRENQYVFDNGTAQAGEGIDGLRGMKFTAADAKAGKVFEYLFTEEGMSENYTGAYESGDFVYDETKYLLQFRPTLVETAEGAELVVELWQAESNAGAETFSEFRKVGSYVANGFRPNLSDVQGREAQSEYTLTFTNKLKPLGLQIVKIEKNTTTRLPYAYFSLEDGEGNKVSAYSASDPTEENKLGADEQATNDQGILYFYGLEDGKTYTLTETKFPSGYQAESEDGVSFQIKVDNGIVSVKNGENEWAPLDPARANGDPNDQNSELVDHCFYIQVSNVKLPDIPASGSNGTLLMMSTGFAAIVLAGTYLSKRFGHLWN